VQQKLLILDHTMSLGLGLGLSNVQELKCLRQNGLQYWYKVGRVSVVRATFSSRLAASQE
jgi:hypothetical protein